MSLLFWTLNVLKKKNDLLNGVKTWNFPVKMGLLPQNWSENLDFNRKWSFSIAIFGHKARLGPRNNIS